MIQSKHVILQQPIRDFLVAMPLPADQTVADLLAERLPLPGARCRLAFVAVGSSTSGRSATDADDMLAEGFGRD